MPSIYYKHYQPNPAGTLVCGGSTFTSITLNFTYTNATTDIRIYYNQTLVHIININASGSGNGSYTAGGLFSGTNYTYKLIHGNNVNEQLLAETQCATLTPPPPPPPGGGGGGGGEPPPPPSNPPARQSLTVYFAAFDYDGWITNPAVFETTGDTQFILGGYAQGIVNGGYIDGQSGILPGGTYSFYRVTFQAISFVTVIATTVRLVTRGGWVNPPFS